MFLVVWFFRMKIDTYLVGEGFHFLRFPPTPTPLGVIYFNPFLEPHSYNITDGIMGPVVAPSHLLAALHQFTLFGETTRRHVLTNNRFQQDTKCNSKRQILT